LLEQFSITCRRRHLSHRTEESYRHWIRHFIFFNNKRHPNEMGAAEVTAFLNHLAVNRNVAASTQTQALNAIVFLYKAVLDAPLGDLVGLRRVQQRARVPACPWCSRWRRSAGCSGA
jgi:site-specific recombinase XerD